MSELQGLQSRIEAIRAVGGEVLAISVDPPARGSEIAEAYGLDYPILSDPQLEAIDAYGLRHPGGGLEGDIARPAAFVVDRDGRVAWRNLPDDWRVRLRAETVLEQLRALP